MSPPTPLSFSTEVSEVQTRRGHRMTISQASNINLSAYVENIPDLANCSTCIMF